VSEVITTGLGKWFRTDATLVSLMGTETVGEATHALWFQEWREEEDLIKPNPAYGIFGEGSEEPLETGGLDRYTREPDSTYHFLILANDPDLCGQIKDRAFAMVRNCLRFTVGDYVIDEIRWGGSDRRPDVPVGYCREFRLITHNVRYGGTTDPADVTIT